MVERVINDICDFLSVKVLPTVTVKQPSETQQDGTYDYTEVHPSVFPFYIPPARDFNDEKIPAPCVCVAPVKETFNLTGMAAVDVRLELIVWNAGVYGDELRTPVDDNEYVRPAKHSSDQSFDLYRLSYQDVWIFAEKVKRGLLTELDAAGYELDAQKGIVTEPPKTAMPELFPYFTATMTFTVKVPTVSGQGLHDLL